MIKQKRNLIHWLPGVILMAFWLTSCSSIQTLFSPSQPEATALPVVEGIAPVTAEGRVVPEKFTTLSFPISGRLESLLADEGGRVEKDALVASLGEREQAQSALAAANVEVEAAQQALTKLDDQADLARSQAALVVEQAVGRQMEAQQAYNETLTRDFIDDLDTKEETLQDRKETLDDRKETLDRYLDLDENNATRVSAQDNYDTALEEYNQAMYERDQLRSQRDSAKASLDLADTALTQAQDDLKKLASGADPDLKTQAEKRLEAANAQVAAAERTLTNIDLRAPFAGELVEVKQVEAGIWLTAGQAVATLADTSQWYIETTDLTELDVVKIQMEDSVTVTLDALPDQEFTGEVVSIARTYTEKSGDILYKVRVRLEDPPDDVRWGFTGLILFGKD
jgi:multidrug efflux pump subunit AcrA (membrane-fusion protein)